MANSGSATQRRMRDGNRTHESAPASRRGSLAAVEDREKSMSPPYGRQWYLRRGFASRTNMVPTGPRKGSPKMIRLGDLPEADKASLPNVLRMIGPDYLVPQDPNDPKAERTITMPFSWGEMPNIAISAKKAAKAERKDKEAKATKRAKKKAR